MTNKNTQLNSNENNQWIYEYLYILFKLEIEGLRRAKESYKPIRMVKKSTIYQKR